MRSQDLWLGFCYDIFTATIVQELLARWIGAELGSYWLCVDSLHLYDRDLPKAQQLPRATVPGPLMTPLAVPWATFDELLATVINGVPASCTGWAELAGVLASYRARKAGDREAARLIADGLGGPLAEALGRFDFRLPLQHRPFLAGFLGGGHRLGQVFHSRFRPGGGLRFGFIVYSHGTP